MDVMGVLPPLLFCRVERLKCLNTEREGVIEQYMEERAVLEKKKSDICKPLYGEIGNVVTGRLDDETKSIHKEGEGENEEEGSKRDDNGGSGDMGEG